MAQPPGKRNAGQQFMWGPRSSPDFSDTLWKSQAPPVLTGSSLSIQEGPHSSQEGVLFPPNSSATQDQNSGGTHQLLSW